MVLKHETTASYIQQWNDQKQHLLKICKCSESIFRNRVKLLADMQLITFVTASKKNDSIRLCSWDQLAKKLNINIDKKLTIQYKINDSQKIFHWLIATEIQANKERQDLAIVRKLDNNPFFKMSLTATLISFGSDRTRLNDAAYLLSEMRTLYVSDFVKASDIHDQLIEVRPENDRCVRTIANSWACKHPVTVSYWKKILQREYVIAVTKVQVESRERIRNKYCKVLWLERPKQTLLCLCDQITLLTSLDPHNLKWKLPD